MDKLGGRKFIIAFVIIAVLLTVFAILALRGMLGEGLAGIIIGAVFGTATQFGLTNASVTKAGIAAGKRAEDEEATLLASFSSADVLARAGGTVNGAVGEMRSGVDAARAEVSANLDAARNRLRGEASDNSG